MGSGAGQPGCRARKVLWVLVESSVGPGGCVFGRVFLGAALGCVLAVKGGQCSVGILLDIFECA